MEPTQEKEFVAEPNFLEVLMNSLNIVPGANGSVMKGGGLQSPNFSKGLSGWRIESNGDVEFNDGTFRGILSAADMAANSLTLAGLLKLPIYLVADLPNPTGDTGANDNSVGTVAWTNPSNAITANGLLAVNNNTSGASVTSNYLKVTDFDYAVPSDAKILGIQVEILRFRRSATSVVDSAVRLVKADGTFTNKNKASASEWSSNTGGELAVYGGPSDLWGESWNPADINDTDFGAVLSCTYANTVAGPGVDSIRVIVFYTGQTAPAGIGSVAFASDAQKWDELTGYESSGAGTGTLVVHDGRGWKNAAKPSDAPGTALGTNGLFEEAVRTIHLTARDGRPTTTIGCSASTLVEAPTNDIDYFVLDFDTTTEERAFWVVQLPDRYATNTGQAGALTARFIWTTAAGLAGETVRWGIKARYYKDDDAIDQAYGTEVTVDDTFLAQGDVHITASTANITMGGSPASNIGGWVVVNVGRKVANDNLTGDARLLGVLLEFPVRSTYTD